jgi:hypothetical protein
VSGGGVLVGVFAAIVPVMRGVKEPVGVIEGVGEGVAVQVIGVLRNVVPSKFESSKLFKGGNSMEVFRIGCAVLLISDAIRFC